MILAQRKEQTNVQSLVVSKNHVRLQELTDGWMISIHSVEGGKKLLKIFRPYNICSKKC